MFPENNDEANANQNQGAGANQGNDAGNANQGGGNSQGGKGKNQGGNQGGQGGNANGSNQGGGQGGDQGGGGEDYKKKFTDSSTEAQRLLKLLTDAGIDPKTGKKAEGGNNAGGGNANQGNQGAADDQTFFTDADLEATFPSFATMSDQEKAVLRQVGSFPKMARMVAEMYDKTTFTEQLEVLKADPANKLLVENEKEFKAYAYKDGNLKLPIEVLVDAFIGKKLREGAAGGGNNQNQGDGKGNQNRAGMENGSAGAGQGNNSGMVEMTAEAARDLRMKDPKKYAKLASAKKLKIVQG